MEFYFYVIEPAFADPCLLDMDYRSIVGPLPLAFEMGEGEFDHFEPLWKFLRTLGVNVRYYDDFLILPQQIVAANKIMNSLWPEIHRTRQFFHPDDDPFWALRDLLERTANEGSGLLALC